MAEALFTAEFGEGLLAVGHGTGVAPDDGVTQRLQVFVHADEAVHLVRDTDGLDIRFVGMALRHDVCRCRFQIVPPCVWCLFCPSLTEGLDGCFCLGVEGSRYALPALCIHQRCLYAGAANVIT